MSLSINTNVNALMIRRQLDISQATMTEAMQRLSSGRRVNSAKDDPAGLAIAERMTAQVRGMTASIRNANDGISQLQTAEGLLGNTTNLLQRMRELAVQSTNGSLTTSDKDALDKEFAQLSNEVDRIAGNSVSSDAQGTQYEIGPGTTSNDWISAPTNVSETLSQLSGGSWGTIGASSTTDSLHAVINSLDQAIDKTGNHRAELGAALSRFDSIISTMQVGIENTSAARSRIIDADFAAETSKLSQSRILQQAGTAMMAMATQQPQMVLQLLR